MQGFLQRLGYTVEGFLNGTDALRCFESQPDRFKIVVTDLTLPDIPGHDLGLSMLKINPSVGILLCSGYPFEVGSLPVNVRTRVAHLQKPFLPKMLEKHVLDLLAKA